jgi:hypothetical protein
MRERVIYPPPITLPEDLSSPGRNFLPPRTASSASTTPAALSKITWLSFPLIYS